MKGKAVSVSAQNCCCVSIMDLCTQPPANPAAASAGAAAGEEDAMAAWCLHTRSPHAAAKASRCMQARNRRQGLRLHQEGRGQRSQRERAAEAGGACADPGRGDRGSEEEVMEGARKSQRFASWREATLICVLVRLLRKMGALFASSVGACFFQLKHCGGRILRLHRVLPTLLETVLGNV